MKDVQLKFNSDGLIPAIIQDAVTKKVLTLAYMNEESLQRTIESGETWLYSRSRQQLWHKGATSGNTQTVQSITYDCDQDALVVLVNPKGPACHTGTTTCFTETLYEVGNSTLKTDSDFLYELETIISDRERQRPEGSYTTYLFEKGVDKILKKVGEESAEVIIAAKNRDYDELQWESADLIFHLLVLLKEQNVPFSDVLAALKQRHENKK